MILITGAGGKTGRALTREFSKNNLRVRAFVRRPEQAEALLQIGATEIHIGDIEVPDDVQQAADGIEIIYHLAPNMHPRETEIGCSILRAAQGIGVKKVVYHSVLHPQTRRMPHHWNKLLVEEQLFETGLVYAIVQPTAYMQNLLANRETMRNEGIYRVPYPVSTRGSLVDLADVAEAAARILTEPRFDFGTFELVGTPDLTQEEIAATAAAILGYEIRAEEIPRSLWRTNAERAGALSPYAIETLCAMFEYYADFSLTGSSVVLEAILGRPPKSLENFFRREF